MVLQNVSHLSNGVGALLAGMFGSVSTTLDMTKVSKGRMAKKLLAKARPRRSRMMSKRKNELSGGTPKTKW